MKNLDKDLNKALLEAYNSQELLYIMKSTILMVLCVLAFCLSWEATADTLVEKQQSNGPGDAIGNTRLDSKFSLLDPNRFSMSQSYTVSYLSYNGHGQTIGLYLNSIRYELSGALDLNVTLGWLHQPSAFLFRNDRVATGYGQILPNFQLRYEPSEKYRFLISYESIPGVYSSFFRTDRRWPYINRNSF